METYRGKAFNSDFQETIIIDKNGMDVCVGDRVAIDIGMGIVVNGTLRYDSSFWAYAVRSDDGKRYLLHHILSTCIETKENMFCWEEIEKIAETIPYSDTNREE